MPNTDQKKDKCAYCRIEFAPTCEEQMCCSKRCRYMTNLLLAKVKHKEKTNNNLEKIAEEYKLHPDTIQRLLFLWDKTHKTGKPMELYGRALILFLMQQEGYNISARLGTNWTRSHTYTLLHRAVKKIRREICANNLHLKNKLNEDGQITELEADRLKTLKGVTDKIIAITNQCLRTIDKNCITKSVKATMFYAITDKKNLGITQERISNIFGINMVTLRNNKEIVLQALEDPTCQKYIM